MKLRWKLIIIELILHFLMELAPASLGILETVAQYIADLSQNSIEACINCGNYNSYIKSLSGQGLFYS